MTDQTDPRATIDAYVSAFNSRDRATWVGLFTADARHEDPVGQPLNIGHEAIGAFFDTVGAMGQVSLTQPRPPIVAGAEALVFLTAVTAAEGMTITVPTIVDHMVFTDDGHISSLRAFWDADSIETTPT